MIWSKAGFAVIHEPNSISRRPCNQRLCGQRRSTFRTHQIVIPQQVCQPLSRPAAPVLVAAAKLSAKPPPRPFAAVALVAKMQDDIDVFVTFDLLDLMVKLHAVVIAALGISADQRGDANLLA